MKRVIAFWAVIAVALGLVLTACGSGGISINSGPQQTQPGPAPATSQECGFTWDSCGPSAPPTKPVSSVDAAPRGIPACELTYDVPRLVPDGVRGFFTIKCQILPVFMLVTSKLQIKNSAGNWVDEGEFQVYNYPDHLRPLYVGVPRGFEWFTKCVPGEWRLDGHWNGIKADGTAFPDPATNDTPNDWNSNEVTIKC